MSIGREGGRLPRQVFVLLVTVAAAAVLWSACGPPVTPLALITSPGGIDSAPRIDVLNSARGQDYDTSHGVGDYRRLMVGNCPECGYGPHVRLHPVRGAWRFDSTMLAEGRFLARLINLDADSYPKFNLAPHDTVYWWVDRRGPGGTWQSVYVSSDLGMRTLRRDSLYHDPHATASRWGRSLARFLWQDTDEALWVACDMTGCCRSSGADIY
jgi:hypothetical protein